MFLFNSYNFSDSEIDTPMNDVPIIVTSAGHHIMLQKPRFDTVRPSGRRDYQILYVKKGRIYYTIDGVKSVCNENCILIYRPYEPQFYTYTLDDSADIYWVHFTGNNVDNFLSSLHLDGERCFSVNSSVDFSQLFDNIISELQLKSYNYAEFVDLNFKLLLYSFSRELHKNLALKKHSYAEIDNAVTYFNTHFNENIDVVEYAKSQNISIGWFTKLFRQQMNTTPHKYLVELRIAKAKSLLISKIPINEVAYMVGFTDPLYFSRAFRKSTGLSPSQFRKLRKSLETISQEDAPWEKKN